MRIPRFLASALILASTCHLARAAGFTVGNVLVLRVGSGSGALSNTGNAVFLDEYSPTGTLVQSVPLPTAAAGGNRPLILDGTATDEGGLTRSTDGRYVVLTGYGAAPGGGTSLSTTGAVTVARVVARIDGAARIDTTTALADFAGGGSPRSATSTDGSALYLAGSNSGVRLATFGATTSTDISTTALDIRAVEICVGQLYASTTSGALRIGTVGSGLPAASGQTIANLPGFPTTGSPHAFFLLDLDATVAGSDTLYVADDVAGAIQKFSLVGGNWTASGSVTAANVRGVTASVSGGTVTLFGTSDSTVFRFADTTGYNGTISGSATALATAGTNTAFRGIAIAPTAGAAIATQPVAQSAVVGGSATFTVAATGSEPLSYQWRRNGTSLTNTVGRIAGATTATLTLSALTLADAGSYDVVVTNPVTPVTSNTAALTVGAATATVTLSNLSQLYTGSALSATVTTAPAGLATSITYNGSATPPTAVGSYTVVATVTDPSYTGSATGTLIIGRAPATVTIGGLTRTFDGSPKPVTVATTPAGLAITVSYNGSPTPPSAPGTYVVLAGVNDGSYDGLAVATLTISRPTATLTLDNLAQVYDGTPRVVSVSGAPAGFTARVTYNGSATPPVNAGSYAVVATLDEPTLAGSAQGTLVVSPATQTLAFSTLPASPQVGVPFAVGATASSGLPVTIAIASGNATLADGTLTLRDTAPVTLRATQAGNANIAAATATLTLAGKQTQTIAFTAPADRAADAAPFAVSATASSGLPVTLTLVSGPATLANGMLTLAGTPGVVVLRATQSGNATFDAAPPVERSFTVTASASAQLVNFSTRAIAGSGDQVVIAGFVIAGTEPKPVLLRAVGPTLRSFGVPTALAAPRLELFRGSTSLGVNTGWSTAANASEIATTATRAGAFPLAANSADAVILTTLAPGAYTAVVTAASGAAGAALVEVYDLSANGGAQRIANLSTRALAGTGDNTLIAGLVVSGPAPKRFLVRAVGPALASFGVPNALARPELTLRSAAGAVVAQNAGWSVAAAEIAVANAQAGAFSFAAASQDAAVVVTLPPGAYTAQVTGVGGTTGAALVEIYELP